jgi:hypothetical protein
MLARYYQEVGPCDISIESYGNPFFLPSLAKLWKFQAGYRWNGLNNKPLAGWNDDWIVVGDQGGDPLIFSRETGKILFAEHGTGSWEPDELFSDLSTMSGCLGAMGTVVAQAGDHFTDDDGYIGPSFRQAAESALTGLLGSLDEARNVLASLGWG